MNIKELQEELIEKISLIPTEDNESSLERALEIINQLGKDHINDVITTHNIGYTALDYIIIFDSKGNNPTLSRRPRINNMILVELENAIRNIEGRTSDQLCFLKFFEFSFITTFVCNFVFYSSKKCIFDNKNPNLIIEKFCIKQQLLLRSYG